MCKRNRISGTRWLRLVAGVALAGLLTGCHTVKTSEPPRTAVEQLLLSTSTDRALRDQDFTWLKGRKIFVEEKYFESYDKGYVISSIRAHISSAGGLLMKSDDKADVIVEIRSGALGLETAETLLGLPSMGIPVPLTGTLQTPELAIYKSQKADAYAKFALYAYQRESGIYLEETGPMDGRAHYRLYKILGINWKRTDIPEMKKQKKKADEDQK